MRADIVNFIHETKQFPRDIDQLTNLIDNNFKLTEVELHTTIQMMIENGDIVINEVVLYRNVDFYIGSYIHKSDMFGFIACPDLDEDFYVSWKNKKNAMSGDTVAFQKHAFRGKDEGKILKVIERKKKKLYVIIRKANNKNKIEYLSELDNLNLQIKNFTELLRNSVDGSVCEISKLRYSKRGISGMFSSIVGHVDDPDFEIKRILFDHGAKIDVNPMVDTEANKIMDLEAELIKKDIPNRRDLRSIFTFTIDGASSKDLDDAISIKKEGQNFRLWVHIADVSFFVEEYSAIDNEAYQRGTSIYIANKVIPMLPHQLSNGVCSLHPDADKLTLTCEMLINREAELLEHDIYPSIIRSDYRMTYDNCNEILAGNKEVIDAYLEMVDPIHFSNELADILFANRIERGALEFNIPEVKIKFDEKDNPIDIYINKRGTSEQIIEEFMVYSNETVAEHIFKLGLPSIYRTHDLPNLTKLNQFIEFFNSLHKMKKMQDVHDADPKIFQDILVNIRGEEDEKSINQILLKSMAKAAYTDEATGHFGLASTYYSHFTSPIRRYPDLMLHRILRELVFVKPEQERVDHYAANMAMNASHCSQQEQIAIKCERSVNSFMFAKYMEDKVGEIYSGIISTVTKFGVFVELPNGIEGLIHISNMTDDKYNFDETHYTLTGVETKKKYHVAQKVKIRVTNVVVSEKKIDFEIYKGSQNDSSKQQES